MKFAETIEQQQPGESRKENMIFLPLGLLGFERIKRYELIANPHEASFIWLQVVGDPNQAFLVVPPAAVVEKYEPELSAEDVAFLGLETAEDAVVYNIVTLRGSGQTTVNLKGPIIVNRHTLIGKQVIPVNVADLPVRHPITVAN
jgi:flagellar assembly factor FliW